MYCPKQRRFHREAGRLVYYRVGDESVLVNLNAAHSALASAFGSMPGSVLID
jgi:hypothetical protein